MAYERLIEEAHRAKAAVYLATDANVADDLSRIIGGLADALEAAAYRPVPQGEPSDAQDVIVQEVSRLAGMQLLRRYSSFSDTWWDELHVGIARVVRAAGVA